MVQLAATRRAAPPNQHRSRGRMEARDPERRATLGSLVFNGRGVVVSCSDGGVRLFGGDHADLEGSAIGSLIPGISPSDATPSFNARHIAYLCSAGIWRRFQAIDVYGQHFPVEIRLSLMSVEKEDMYLMNVRQPSAG